MKLFESRIHPIQSDEKKKKHIIVENLMLTMDYYSNKEIVWFEYLAQVFLFSNKAIVIIIIII